MTKLFVAILLLSLQMSGASAQLSAPNLDAEASSLRQLANELRSTLGQVRFHREEQFEDRLRARGTKSFLLPHIYQIQADPSDDEVLTRSLPAIYIAVSHDGLAVYRLSGFPNAERHFDDLVRDQLSPPIRTKEEAESRGLLCAEIVYGTSPRLWIEGGSSVQLKAAEHFFSEGHQDGLSLASKWWKSAKGNRTDLVITTLPKSDGFELNLPVFWAPVEGHSVPEVQLYRIDISDAGACTMPASPSVVLR
jgi:hypothetical protein